MTWIDKTAKEVGLDIENNVVSVALVDAFGRVVVISRDDLLHTFNNCQRLHTAFSHAARLSLVQEDGAGHA